MNHPSDKTKSSAKANWLGHCHPLLVIESYSTEKNQCLACWVKFSVDILKYFSFFPMITGFDISCKLSPLETICMKCQILLSGKNKKKIISLSSAEFAHRMVKDKQLQVKVDLIRLDLMGDRPVIPHYNLALDKKIFFVTETVIFFFFCT